MNRSVDNSTTDNSTRINPSVKQDLTVKVEEANDPQAVRREAKKVSGQKATEGIADALQRENNQ